MAKIQKITQLISKRWQNNYLSQLQERNKWLFKKPNILPGMLVLHKNSELPFCTFSIGCIIKVISGADREVRVVEIRTTKDIRKTAKLSINILHDLSRG